MPMLRGLLLTVLLGLCVLTACASTPTPLPPTPTPESTIGAAIAGTYTVHFGPDLILLGQLNLSEGQYTFTPQTTAVPATIVTDAAQRLFFLRHPQGSYRLEYAGSLTPNHPLVDLADGEILVTIIFDITGTASPTPGISIDQAFLIRNDSDTMRLYFHSIVSEIEWWRIEKPWAAGSK